MWSELRSSANHFCGYVFGPQKSFYIEYNIGPNPEPNPEPTPEPEYMPKHTLNAGHDIIHTCYAEPQLCQILSMILPEFSPALDQELDQEFGPELDQALDQEFDCKLDTGLSRTQSAIPKHIHLSQIGGPMPG
jgi:hypothetical protein